MRAARALLGIDQRQLAALAGVSLPTIQRMEASDGQVRSVVDTLVKVINAIESAGIEIIGENAQSSGAGRGVRLKETAAGGQTRHIPSVLFDQTAQDDAC
ncbi:XRE family transcriptional regulator [Sphingobium baderi LL03]|uniref:XRE family transcriptional regulator n=2 Tax=Sphingomonadaceae TaxID=41297 RepID=T0HX48_9SPHN|nr:XRE family transcriptional regulator [Sphingobium sp. TKS]EQB02134.1 XRE family transcriptional regulator [Sphingobium baderi LL03]